MVPNHIDFHVHISALEMYVLQPGSGCRVRQCRQDRWLHPSPGARRARDDPVGVWPRTGIAGQDRRVQGHAAGHDLQRPNAV